MCYPLGNEISKCRMPMFYTVRRLVLDKEKCRYEEYWLTETAPQVTALLVKHAATQTQPYPPSKGLISSSEVLFSWLSLISHSAVAGWSGG
jgi:hypothetical protein